MFGQYRPTRESVFKALFALTSGVQFDIGEENSPNMVDFKTRTRRIKLFSDVPSPQQPWLGQAEHNERSEQISGKPYKRVWAASWMVYHQAGKSPSVDPTVWNNQIIDALEAALDPRPEDPGFFENRNTLSGLVYHCFIDGEIFKDPGDIDNQALIVIPIKLLVP